MALAANQNEKADRILTEDPKVTIFLKPIAAPAALGLAGFAGSTWITASWVANWWGSPESPTIFFPFVAFFGGLAQFVAGIHGFGARDVLITVIHTMWGALWMSVGLLYLLVAAGAVPPHPIDEHFPELASWFVVLTFFTWSGAFASAARDLALCGVLTCLATGSTIAICLYAYNPESVGAGIKAAAYFWIFSSILAWWRVTVYLVEEAYGKDSVITRFFPIFRTPMEQRAPLIVPGFGEPGVKRGMPGLI